MTASSGASGLSPLSAGVVGADWYATHVAVRLEEFFFPHAPWQRRLWDAGTVSALKEVLEASRWHDQNVLSGPSVQWLAVELERITGQDPGTGDSIMKKAVATELRSGVAYDSRHWRRLQQLTGLITDGYLSRWATAIDSGAPPGAERAARAIAAHLLDQGYSQAFLHAWVCRLVRSGCDLRSIIDDAIRLDERELSTYDVLLPFAAMPHPTVAQASGRWQNPQEVRKWLAERGGLPTGTLGERYAGAFEYKVTARDPYSVVRVMESVTDRLFSRSRHVPGYSTLEALNKVWLQNPSRHSYVSVFELQPQHRGTYVRSLLREKKVHDVTTVPTVLDDALELASGMNSSSPGPAIATGWSAFEALLYSPGDPADGKDGRGVVACDRAAALVTCSWARAELTPLTHRRSAPDAQPAVGSGTRGVPGAVTAPGPASATPSASAPLLGSRAAAAAAAFAGNAADDGSIDRSTFDRDATNQERCRELMRAYAGGRYLRLTDPGDAASQERMLALMQAPQSELREVRRPIQHAFRRMYRYRNIVVHGGASSTAGLEGALRIVAPLAGAALDRIVHASLSENTKPLTLAARAELHLELLGSAQAPSLVDLLG